MTPTINTTTRAMPIEIKFHRLLRCQERLNVRIHAPTNPMKAQRFKYQKFRKSEPPGPKVAPIVSVLRSASE
jgi:hypothetical protein